MRISIITINYNNAIGLRKTMESVLSQTTQPFEYIVIDGGSTDGSAELIKQYSGRLAYWVSERDNGIYHAMNKGIDNAHGDYCIFLNSGDCLLSSDVLARLEDEIDGTFDVYYSDHWVSNGRKQWKCFLPQTVDVNYFTYLSISHPNSVIKKDILLKCGKYREDFRISSDWFFFLDAIYTHHAKFLHINTDIACFYYQGMSSSHGAQDMIVREREEGIRSVFKDLAPIVSELNGYRDSVYGYLVRSHKDSRLLSAILRGYRFASVRIDRLLGRPE